MRLLESVQPVPLDRCVKKIKAQNAISSPQKTYVRLVFFIL